MAQRDRANFKATKDSRYEDNTSGGISESDSRNMFEDTADSAVFWVDDVIDDDTFATASPNTVPTSESVKAYVDAQSSSVLIRSKLTVTPAQILNSNSSPITLISAPGANKAIRIISLSMLIDFNSTAYATNTNTTITQGALNATSAGVFGISAGDSTLLQVNGTTSSQLWSIIVNKPIVWTTTGGNPTDGDSDIHFDIVYQIVEML